MFELNFSNFKEAQNKILKQSLIISLTLKYFIDITVKYL